MALVEVSHSGTTFASITSGTGEVTLNTANKTVTENIKVKANISGEKSITNASSTDVTGYATAKIDSTSATNLVAGNIKSGVSILGVTGSLAERKNVQVNNSMTRSAASSLTNSNISVTVDVAGTYNIYWMSYYAYTSTATNSQTRLYKNTSAIGRTVGAPIYSNSTATNLVHSLTNQTLAAGDTISIYVRSASTSRYVYTGMLMVVQQ